MEIPIRVLIIEDSEDDTLLIVHQLERAGYKLTYERVETADAMHEALERETWDIIISDYNMPHFNGLEALKLYKEKGLDIPFIIVSGAIGEEIAATATVSSGAHDYVMKSNLSRLVPAIQRELREAESKRERKLTEQELLLTDIRQEALLKLYQMADIPLDTITGFVVEECLKMTGSEIAFIGYINEDETIMHTHLWSKKAMKQWMKQCSVDGKPVKFPLEQAGLWGEAIRQKKPIIVNNYSEPNPYKRGYPEGHLSLVRFMSVPLIDRNRVVLVAGVANKKEPYTGSDITHTSLLLEGMWNYIQRRKAEDGVRTSEQKYRSIFENSVEGIFQTSPEGQFLNINPSYARMTGYAS
ncbi:MAG: GAF domain-containing protein, partial [Proteobacteria bacterium]|nr:GAF domain-containing protein [Pseudomonadota bacterium]